MVLTPLYNCDDPVNFMAGFATRHLPVATTGRHGHVNERGGRGNESTEQDARAGEMGARLGHQPAILPRPGARVLVGCAPVHGAPHSGWMARPIRRGRQRHSPGQVIRILCINGDRSMQSSNI
jgi:hypothetical protein